MGTRSVISHTYIWFTMANYENSKLTGALGWTNSILHRLPPSQLCYDSRLLCTSMGRWFYWWGRIIAVYYQDRFTPWLLSNLYHRYCTTHLCIHNPLGVISLQGHGPMGRKIVRPPFKGSWTIFISWPTRSISLPGWHSYTHSPPATTPSSTLRGVIPSTLHQSDGEAGQDHLWPGHSELINKIIYPWECKGVWNHNKVDSAIVHAKLNWSLIICYCFILFNLVLLSG